MPPYRHIPDAEKDRGKILLSKKGLVMNISGSDGALGKLPARGKVGGLSNVSNKSAVNAMICTHKKSQHNPRIRLRPVGSIETSPINTLKGMVYPGERKRDSSSSSSSSSSMFYESQQNRYSVRRYELPK
jgi:Tfp pilus tip-associated adhesin PilY1